MKPTHTLSGLLSVALESIRGLLGNGSDSTQVKVGTLQGKLRAVNRGLGEAQGLKAAIKEAIEAKTPSVEATDDLTTWPEAIESIQTGETPTPPPDDVMFMDWDGTVVKSYSFTQAKALTALPTLPRRTGLTNEGWNYTLAQVKTAANQERKTLVGCTYKTSDNITKIYVTIPADDLTFHLNFAQASSRSNNLSWGDGTGDTPGSTNLTTREHVYSAPGNYTITIEPVSSNTVKFTGPICGNYVNDCNKITAIDFGGVHTIGRCFYHCDGINAISIPKGVTLEGRVMDMFTNLETFVIPSGPTTLPTYFFQYAAGLKKVSIPPTMTEISEKCFYNCGSLEEIRLPISVTTLRDYAFYGCGSLRKVYGTITDHVEWNVFGNCAVLEDIDAPSGSYGSGCFYYCRRLKSLNPGGVITNLGDNANFAQDAVALEEIGELQVAVIPERAFYGCVSLKNVKITGCTSIESAAFRYCGCHVYDFTGCTQVPQIQNNTFTDIPMDSVFIVPANLYSQWIVADVWSGLASRIQSA